MGVEATQCQAWVIRGHSDGLLIPWKVVGKQEAAQWLPPDFSFLKAPSALWSVDRRGEGRV